jgi:hypothetical protein
MSKSSKKTKGVGDGSSKSEREKLEADVKSVAKENAALNARLLEVEKKMGRITQKPTAADRMKAALFPKRFDPLAKLTDEREQILGALRVNRERGEAAAKGLEVKPTVRFASEEKVEMTTPKETVGETLRRKNTAQGTTQRVGMNPEAQNVPVVSLEQDPLRTTLPSDAYSVHSGSETPKVEEEDPLRSKLGESAYAPSLGSETPGVEEDPLRSELGEDAYAPSLGSKMPRVEEDPLRSELGEDAYAPFLGSKMPGVEEDPLRSELGEDAYAPFLGSEMPGVEENPLRSGLGENAYAPSLGYGTPVVDETDLLQSEGPSVSEEDALRTVSVTAYDGVELGDLDSLDDGMVSDLSSELDERKPEQQVNQEAKFKMKGMEEVYVNGEKMARSTQVRIGDKEVTVQDKDWLRDHTNEDRRKQNQVPFSKEIWEKSGIAAQQPRTQYFDEEQRRDHQVALNEGILENEKGKLAEGSHVFVMDGEGQIYAKGTQEALTQVDDQGRVAHVHHSSFLAGGEVAGAGELRVGKDGELKEINDGSGHYKPGEVQTKQTLETIEEQGVSLDNVKFTQARGLDRGQDKTTGMAKEFLQGQVTPEEKLHREQQQAQGKSVRDTSKVMEQTFKGRHNVADEIKGQGESVRDRLRKTDNLEKIENGAPKKGLGRVR